MGQYKASTYTSSKREFEIIGAEGVILDSRVDDFVEEDRFAKEVFSYAKPETEELWIEGLVFRRHRIGYLGRLQE